MVTRPRVSDVVNKKTAKFTIDTLVEMPSRVGKPGKLAISRGDVRYRINDDCHAIVFEEETVCVRLSFR